MDDTEWGGPIVNILGERVALGPTGQDLLPLVHHWNNDFESMQFEGELPVPHTLDEIAKWHERQPSPGEDVRFLIYELHGWRPIGLARPWLVDHRDRTATFAILIDERDACGKGYGTETTRLVLRYAFTALGMHNVFLSVYEFNAAGIRAYEKADFRETGRRRQCYRMGGRVYDEIDMDCLAAEFESPVLARVFAGGDGGIRG